MNSEQLNKFVIYENQTIVEALQKIDLNAKGILFILNDKDRLVGTLTDGDIRRWLIKTGNLNGNLTNIMNKAPKFICRKDITSAQQFLKKYSITAVPVINTKGKIIDVIFKSDEKIEDNVKDTSTLSGTTVIIMAGGKGTRLYPFTKILPKPLIPIGDIPIMERIIDRFVDYGVDSFYATLNYKKNMIKSYFSDIQTSYEINYVEEDKPLGTGGSLHLIKESFIAPIIVINCDILISADYSDIYKNHIENGNDMTIVTALKNIIVPYGVINLGESGNISSIEEKPRLSYFVNTGMYIINPDIISKIPKDTFFHMTDLTQKLLNEGKTVGMYPISENSFLDMGEFEEMHRMEEKLNIKAE